MADDKDNEKKKVGADDKAVVEKRPAKKPAPKPPVDEEEDDEEEDDEEEDDEEEDDEEEEPVRPARRGAAATATVARRVAVSTDKVVRPGIKSFLPWIVVGMGMVGAYAYIEKPNDIRNHAILAVLGIACVIYGFIGIGSMNEIKN